MGLFCFWLLGEVYPKVKVRVQREEADQYSYEKSSLQSLKAFGWLSLNQLSSSDYPKESVARIPRSYVPRSPPPSFYTSKVEKNQNTKTDHVEEDRKSIRASSAPRPRAVLSSPDNDGLIASKIKTKAPMKKEQPTVVKNHNSSQNRHTQCKIFPKSAAAESFGTTQGHDKRSGESKINITRAKTGTTVTDPSSRVAHHRKIAPASVQHRASDRFK